MTDLVEILQAHCTTLNWEFSYGNRANQNLIDNEKASSTIYLLLDPLTRLIASSEFGGDGATEFSSSFMLLVQSDLDNVVYNQNGNDKAEGKYELNIKPLLTQLESLKSLIDCSDYEIQSWSVVDAIDVLDANTDGLVVTFKIKKL